MNNDNTVKWNDVKRKIWFEQTKAKAKYYAHNTVEWVRDNKEFALAAVTATTAVVGKGIAIYDRCQKRKNERYVYDYSMRTHRKLKHKLTNKDKADINRLVSQGYSYHEAYNILGLVY